MTDMKKKYYKRKADTVRKTRKVSFSTACKRLEYAFDNLRKATC